MEKTCKYCRTEEEEQVKLKEETISLGALGHIEHSVYIDYYQNCICSYIDLENGDNVSSNYIRIKYCPMCGKKLNKKGE